MAPVAQTPKKMALSGARLVVVLAATGFLGACAGSNDMLPSTATLAADPDAVQAVDALDPKAELRKATEYWGQQYNKKPNDKTAALNYAKNLKASGDKRQALMVLQNSFSMNSSDPEIAGELGRLALEFDQLSLASRALTVADVAENTDWRVVSARGTVLAKQGQHKAAIPYFERALTMSPNQPSVLNNLAMANAMSGNPQKAEQILRDLAQLNGAPAKVSQNLALVLGLQGKYDESKAAGAAVASNEVAAANTDYIRQLVQLQPTHTPAAAPSSTTAVAQATPALKPANIETSSGGWNTAVTASAEPSSMRGSNH